MKLRYTGPDTVTFHTAGVGEVEPGTEFTVPDEMALSFLARDDIEEVEDIKPVTKKKAAPGPAPEPLPETVEAIPAADTETL